MNEHDIRFKKTALNIGTTLLLFLALYHIVYSNVCWYLQTNLYFKFQNTTIANIVTELSSGVLYLAVFLIPAFLCLALNKKNEKKSRERLKPRCSPAVMALTVLASIGIIMGAAYVNSILASILGVSGNVLPTDNEMSLADFILSTVTVALVPGFCEEFLFRKTILSSLLPYGEGFAIIASSVLFGLMHQNILQIFYATMAGIVLGCAYSRTRSFLCVFLIHFFNNFTSVIGQYFASDFNEKTSNILGTTFTAIILIAGIASVSVLMLKETQSKSVYTNGSFEKIEIPSVNYVKYELAANPTTKLFLSPTVLIFTIISSSLCIATLFL